MGQVYRVTDRKLGRDIALKLVPQDVLFANGVRERFRREVETLAGVCHPHIIRLFDYEELEDGNVFYTMELIEGDSLAARLEKRKLSIEKATEIVEQVAEALGAIHDLDIVHRDIKPDNILITRHGMAKIADFGLAGGGESGVYDKLTKTGQIVGTAQYIAPELMWGEKASCRSDIYQLGLVLYEALTGECPITMLHLHSFARRELKPELPKASSLRDGIDNKLNEIISKAMALDPNDRYENINEFRSELRKWRSKYLASQSVLVKGVDKGKKPPLLPWIVLLVFLFVAFLLWPRKNAQLFSSFSVESIGSRSCLLVWSSEEEPEAVVVHVRDLQGRDVHASFIPLESENKRGSIIVRGLNPLTSYDVQLNANNTSSKMRSFKTRAKSQGKLLRQIRFPREEQATIIIERDTPFRLEGQNIVSRAKKFRQSHELTYSIKELVKKPVRYLRLFALDGDERTITVDSRLLLGRAFEDIAASFERSLATGSFYRVLADQKGRLNPIMRPPAKGRELTESYREMWSLVKERLQKNTLWYGKYERLELGLLTALQAGLVDETNGLAVTNGLAPLALFNGAARWCSVKPHPQWAELFSLLYDKKAFCSKESTLKYVKGIVSFKVSEEPQIPLFMLFDFNHPKAAIMPINPVSQTTRRRDYLGHMKRQYFGRKLDFILQINVRAPLCQTMLRVDINDGKCTANVPVPDSHWLKYRSLRDLNSDYSFMMLGMKFIRGERRADLPAAALEVSKGLPKEKFPIFMKVPMDTFKAGENKISLSVINGPVDDLVALVVERPQVLIGK